jgi:hypothetical protein
MQQIRQLQCIFSILFILPALRPFGYFLMTDAAYPAVPNRIPRTQTLRNRRCPEQAEYSPMVRKMEEKLESAWKSALCTERHVFFQ